MSENQVPLNEQQPNSLELQLEESRREAAENRDKYLRALAESENTRKRVERLCEERMWQERKRLLVHLIELGDQLAEALKYAVSDDPVVGGVRLTLQNLQQVLTNEGAQHVASVGQAFDPNIHEAVEIADDEGEANQVTYEYRKGYMLNGRLLRPARVQVRKPA